MNPCRCEPLPIKTVCMAIGNAFAGTQMTTMHAGVNLPKKQEENQVAFLLFEVLCPIVHHLMPNFLAMSFGRASLWTTMFKVL